MFVGWSQEQYLVWRSSETGLADRRLPTDHSEQLRFYFHLAIMWYLSTNLLLNTDVHHLASYAPPSHQPGVSQCGDSMEPQFGKYCNDNHEGTLRVMACYRSSLLCDPNQHHGWPLCPTSEKLLSSKRRLSSNCTALFAARLRASGPHGTLWQLGHWGVITNWTATEDEVVTMWRGDRECRWRFCFEPRKCRLRKIPLTFPSCGTGTSTCVGHKMLESRPSRVEQPTRATRYTLPNAWSVYADRFAGMLVDTNASSGPLGYL